MRIILCEIKKNMFYYSTLPMKLPAPQLACQQLSKHQNPSTFPKFDQLKLWQLVFKYIIWPSQVVRSFEHYGKPPFFFGIDLKMNGRTTIMAIFASRGRKSNVDMPPFPFTHWPPMKTYRQRRMQNSSKCQNNQYAMDTKCNLELRAEIFLNQ